MEAPSLFLTPCEGSFRDISILALHLFLLLYIPLSAHILTASSKGGIITTVRSLHLITLVYLPAIVRQPPVSHLRPLPSYLTLTNWTLPPLFNMVHLGKIATDKDVADRAPAAIDESKLGAPGQDEFTGSVYGSRFAAADLPKHEMPEDEMPREVAYRMIKYVDGDLLVMELQTDKRCSKQRRLDARWHSDVEVSSDTQNRLNLRHALTTPIASHHSSPPTWKMKPKSS